MATAPKGVSKTSADRKFDVAALFRMASWGIGAAAALFLAVLASLSDTGARRLTAAVSDPPVKTEKSAALQIQAPTPVAVTQIQAPLETPPPPAPQPQAPLQVQPREPSPETRRLQEQVRLLVADQDRLIQRISLLERSLNEATGSIRQQLAEVRHDVENRPPAPAPVASGPVSTVSWPAIVAAIETSGPAPKPETAEALPEVTASIPQETPLPPSRPAEESNPEDTAAASPAEPAPPPMTQASAAPEKRVVHGVDLGGATSIDKVRILWRALQANEATLLRGLRPIVQVTGTRRGGQLDVRLIAGPLANDAAAAKLCSELLNAGRYCEPAAYRGQRLSAR